MTDSASDKERGSPLAGAESGIAKMIASLERGVMQLGQGGDDLDASTKQAAVEAAPPVRTKPIPAGRTYDEVLAPIRWRRIVWGALALVVLLVGYFAATLLQVWTAADDDETRDADVIVVLGAAQFDGTPSPVFAARLDRALELWVGGYAPHIVTTGSNQLGDRFTEGFSGYVYLLDAGVPDEALIPIVDGGDTFQQLSATANQMEQRELESALLVSDGYHSYRLRAIAEEVGIEAFVAPTGVDSTVRDYLREAAAVSVGRVVGYRRLSSVNTSD